MTNAYYEMTNDDFLRMMYELAQPTDDPTAEYAYLMDEAAKRIKILEAQVVAWEDAANMASGADTPEGLVKYIISAGCS